LAGSDIVAKFSAGSTNSRTSFSPLNYFNSIWKQYWTGSNIVSTLAALLASPTLPSATVISLHAAQRCFWVDFFTGSAIVTGLITDTANSHHLVT
jgi:hypothetical protein